MLENGNDTAQKVMDSLFRHEKNNNNIKTFFKNPVSSRPTWGARSLQK